MSENKCCSSKGCCCETKMVSESHVCEVESCEGKSDEDSYHAATCTDVAEKTEPHPHTHCCEPRTPSPHLAVVECTTMPCCTSKHGHYPYNDNCASASSNDARLNDTAHDIDFTIIEIENPFSGRITLTVQGMTCTGCEKNLQKALSSFPEISSITTNLLLAQAEFDFTDSESLQADHVARAIAKKTGFVCERVIHGGSDSADIDVLIAKDFSDSESCIPVGVSDVVKTGKDRRRVIYNPNTVGARDLLSNPYFQHAKLAPPFPPALVASGKAHVRHEFLMTLLSTILTIPVLVISFSHLPEHRIIYGGVCLGLASLVQIVVGGPFYPRALKSLIYSRLIEMDMLVVLSTTTAYVYSVIAFSFLVSGKPLSTPEFFETSTLLVTLIMIGRTFSAYARQKAVESISIESKQETRAIIVQHDGENLEIDARLLQYGDTFKVFPEATLVTDGIVIEGESEVDESLITGEATMIVKRPGMPVIAGSINHSGTLLVRLRSLPHENTISTIGAMVDAATSSRPKVQEIADQVAGYFVPLILALTIIVFAIWVVIGKIVRLQSTTTASITAMTYAISVLIVSCPCAIGLAVPMVAVIAGGVGAKHGLIIKYGQSLEIGRKVTHVVFDKTGTLTEGKLSVEKAEYIGGTPEYVRAVVLGLASGSKHPVSTAIASHFKKNAPGIEMVHITGAESIFGCGIEAKHDGRHIRAGNPYWLGVQNTPTIYALIQRGFTIFCVAIDGQLMAAFGLQDQLRIDAVDTISNLKYRGITVSLTSGDNENAVNLVTRQLGIPASNTRSRCSPADKQEYIKSLSLSGETVLFCGDGTNDAGALAEASIGMHINQGTDVAGAAAHVVLMRPTLENVLTMIDLSKAFHKRVVFNFAWSFVYNIFAILLAAGAFPRARIEPRYAGLGELCSVLPVIAIALGLRMKKF